MERTIEEGVRDGLKLWETRFNVRQAYTRLVNTYRKKDFEAYRHLIRPAAIGRLTEAQLRKCFAEESELFQANFQSLDVYHLRETEAGLFKDLDPDVEAAYEISVDLVHSPLRGAGRIHSILRTKAGYFPHVD
jgi:hypothetical protein